MPTAVCTECRALVHWRNQRGARIAGTRCRCGGSLEAAIWSDEPDPREPGPYSFVGSVPTSRREERERRKHLGLPPPPSDNHRAPRAA